MIENLGAVTVSVGAAIYPVHTTQREELIFLARQAACLARQHGGNQAGTNFDPELIEKFCSILDLDGNIHFPERKEVQDMRLLRLG